MHTHQSVASGVCLTNSTSVKKQSLARQKSVHPVVKPLFCEWLDVSDEASLAASNQLDLSTNNSAGVSL